MTVKDLRALLDQLPDDAPLFETRYSDFQVMDAKQPLGGEPTWEIVKAVKQQGGEYYMRVYDAHIPTMDPKDVERIEVGLLYNGN